MNNEKLNRILSGKVTSNKMDKTVTENNTEIKNKDIVSNVSDKKVLLIPSKH